MIERARGPLTLIGWALVAFAVLTQVWLILNGEVFAAKGERAYLEEALAQGYQGPLTIAIIGTLVIAFATQSAVGPVVGAVAVGVLSLSSLVFLIVTLIKGEGFGVFVIVPSVLFVVVSVLVVIGLILLAGRLGSGGSTFGQPSGGFGQPVGQFGQQPPQQMGQFPPQNFPPQNPPNQPQFPPPGQPHSGQFPFPQQPSN